MFLFLFRSFLPIYSMHGAASTVIRLQRKKWMREGILTKRYGSDVDNESGTIILIKTINGEQACDRCATCSPFIFIVLRRFIYSQRFPVFRQCMLGGY